MLLDALHCVDHLTPSESVPSWVPDWGSYRQTHGLGYGTRGRGTYRTAADTKSSISLLDGDRSLRPLAKVIGIIKSIGPVLTRSAISDLIAGQAGLRTDTKPSFLESIELVRQVTRHPYANLFAAFMRTCFVGVNGDELSLTPDDWEPVFSLVVDTATGISPPIAGQTYPPRRLN